MKSLSKESIQLLSQGTFGCAYFPYVNCDGTPDTTYEYLTKIQIESTFEREKYIGEKIKEIPNYSYYYAPVVDGCALSLDKFKEHVDTTSCKVIQKYQDKTGNGKDRDIDQTDAYYYAYDYEYMYNDDKDGNEEKENVENDEKENVENDEKENVENDEKEKEKENDENEKEKENDEENEKPKKPMPVMYTSKIKFIPGESLHSYLKRKHVEFAQSDTVSHFQQIYRIYYVCKYAIDQLKEKQIVHYDVKLENIMYNFIQRAPILIDFGLSIYIPDAIADQSQLRKYLYTPKFYQFWPIESFLASNMAWESELDHAEAVDEFVQKISGVLEESIQTHPNKKQIYAQIEKFRQAHLDASEDIEDYLKSMPSWDLYGLSVAIVRILPYLYHYKPAEEWANQLFMYIFSDKGRAVL